MEWTQQLVARQKQRTERIRKETENIKAILDAERLRQVQAIKTSQHIGTVLIRSLRIHFNNFFLKIYLWSGSK